MSADARALVRAAGGDELLERLDHLDAVRARGVPAPDAVSRAPDASAAIDVDVAIVGGGLSLLIAPVLAAHGVRVAVFERARVGAAHREWNASARELAPLVASGLVTAAELDALIVARYEDGTCRFHGGGVHSVRGVLDHAVDASALLAHARSAAVARGVALHDGHTLVSHGEGREGVALRFALSDGGHRDVVARIMVDARGASSPYATADMVCPTVGGVVAGLAEGDAPDEVDPRRGEILATIDDARDGIQHVWEGFPGRRGETTVYLFHYARASRPTSLVALYARFFADLGRYKRGDARLVRPTFGYITGWSRLTPAPRAPHPRIVLVGDAAARHSPLTLCGFGAMLRSFIPAADAIAAGVHDPRALGAMQTGAAHDASIHALAGALATMLAEAEPSPGALNALLDAAFGTLAAMPNDAYGALLRDEMSPRAFTDFLRLTATKRPSVYREVLSTLGAGRLTRWGMRVAREVMRA